jgi:hypothetical protein
VSGGNRPAIIIQYRPVCIGGPEFKWQATGIQPFDRADADRKADACRRAMPLREYRVLEIDDEDIPF